jgi:hypothetical protein
MKRGQFDHGEATRKHTVREVNLLFLPAGRGRAVNGLEGRKLKLC